MTRVWKRSKENFAQAAQRLSGVPAGIRKSFPCRKRNYLKRHAKGRSDADRADGARHLPCKAPAEHEPALLSSSDLVIGVTGLSALGQPLGKGCFRAERAAELLGCTMEHHITEEDLARLIASEQGQQKDLKGRTFYAVLHQYEEKEHRRPQRNLWSCCAGRGSSMFWLRARQETEDKAVRTRILVWESRASRA